MQQQLLSACAIVALALALTAVDARADDADGFQTATPIKHLVVIFQENVSFDHYFGTYPHAQNNPGETPFKASKRTPTSINTLLTPLDVNNGFTPLTGVDLMKNNPNNNPHAPNNGALNGNDDAANPFRLSPAQALTKDQNHAQRAEQAAYNNGNMDGFPAWLGVRGPPPAEPPRAVKTKGLVMGYFDGNTVTALWNYAQHFAMNDNAFQSQFGPSTPGAINLISGQTNGVKAYTGNPPSVTLGNRANEAFGDASASSDSLTLIGDPDPLLDKCSDREPNAEKVTLAGRNIGDLLNAKGITWGWFQGGFDLTIVNAGDPCKRVTQPQAPGTPSSTLPDYIPHHQPFQYYVSTRNPDHQRPTSAAAIGKTDAANHQYDTHDFSDALDAGHLPAVTFLKAPAFQDGHAGHSDPLREQQFIVQTVNKLQGSPPWRNMAVIIVYDDSDGWYDHQMPPIVNPSFNPDLDTLNGHAMCNHGAQQGKSTPAQPLNGAAGMPAWGRCGYGARVPFLVVSPFAKRNFVDHTLIDQTSVLRFIEDNWLGGERIQPGGSFDTIAGTIENMFDFSPASGPPRQVLLDLKGQVTSVSGEPDDNN